MVPMGGHQNYGDNKRIYVSPYIIDFKQTGSL